MNVQLLHNGTDRTTDIIEYQRSQFICSGVGLLNFNAKVDRGYLPYDTIVIYEEGVKRGTYYVGSVERSYTSGVTVSCQDGTKKLMDYFISEIFDTGDVPYYAQYLLEKYLTEAGVAYSIDATTGNSLVSNDTSFGHSSAYDCITPLLEQCGWYIYFDIDGLCHVNHISVNIDDYASTLNDDRILSLVVNKNDKMLRNKAIVWGKADPLTGQWVFASSSTITPYNYDENDYRSVILAKDVIKSVDAAILISKQLLDEFAKITEEKTVSLSGVYTNVDIGSTVYLNSKYYTKLCLVTSTQVTMNKNGLITTLTLDQRCPRLIAYFDFGGDVYVGTLGNGIWKKHFRYDHTWRDFSTGLTNRY
jgi:hypothetical protein